MAVPHARGALLLLSDIPLNDNSTTGRADSREGDVLDLNRALVALVADLHDDLRVRRVLEGIARAGEDGEDLADDLGANRDRERLGDDVRAVVDEDEVLAGVLRGESADMRVY